MLCWIGPVDSGGVVSDGIVGGGTLLRAGREGTGESGGDVGSSRSPSQR